MACVVGTVPLSGVVRRAETRCYGDSQRGSRYFEREAMGSAMGEVGWPGELAYDSYLRRPGAQNRWVRWRRLVGGSRRMEERGWRRVLVHPPEHCSASLRGVSGSKGEEGSRERKAQQPLAPAFRPDWRKVQHLI